LNNASFVLLAKKLNIFMRQATQAKNRPPVLDRSRAASIHLSGFLFPAISHLPEKRPSLLPRIPSAVNKEP
jgi:hypothetical protein